jgi:hypothetical protein
LSTLRSSACAQTAPKWPVLAPLLDQRQVGAQLDLPADGVAAAGERHLPVDAPLSAVDRRRQLERRSLRTDEGRARRSQRDRFDHPRSKGNGRSVLAVGGVSTVRHPKLHLAGAR